MAEPTEMSTVEVRANLADVLNAASAHDRITYVTSHGRRIAAIVPLAVAESAENSAASRLRAKDALHPRPEGRSTAQDRR
ncbi:type II toxin-antitoxin system prevent-host-death family antitoxin [Streptomyces fuscigenes]|uniref:type II toxin-antitoxin system prevent-host-death family antitoxin n=1 Tax=Streptomyces fuscigenes TaxID=1528880 RepID=UPI001F2AE57A|nr:type II toxin-antitoxin system prevent-host-death family antitoxin [Streptomyces fuscigenes]MCF3962455.1 type II toxin-antitoxin system prevent-host-death family antitoxin [Streptomyces fuscigenes]